MVGTEFEDQIHRVLTLLHDAHMETYKIQLYNTEFGGYLVRSKVTA